ncbi:DUF1554 domain-containing protein [Leptospira sp. 2 VSF19]|uniref:DUF1554 domain-containing protein n=1 Tax=Leptospira soteropolitanensis TaxID=2950025 RepID=A0AAW5VKX5_9LEPT|nr:DUF1554 domain-containing protein [Leptospira soteropolitanensis]MCW7494611.1 DUF1554 domain-containing protein [Leptospira soteropolitanensis]MCW7502221.1 DUF1554 domain-containing protein [Leptospira soteropolitanensis]MCW7524457.1 DUF1554 domain-containing protein [Leptospira soteropolitanensis]MCW7528323.1 DUF1554 domain-containing protein [Leptospira soteropolitanensis]MCW7532176.1 DUF1554 domain-containing protein [Leptospira soteropolitanensis]
MRSSLLLVLFLVFILGFTCKTENICNVNDSEKKCGLTNIILQSNCEVSPFPPAVPQNLTISPKNGQIVLKWDSSYCANQYQVYWSNSPNLSILNANKMTTKEATFTHTGLTNGTIYYYKITAENILNHKESLPSVEVSASPTIATLKTFVTAIAYSVPAIGSVAGADTICNNDAGKPAGSSLYKALLVDESGCSSNPCRRASVTANLGDGQIDWVLKPNTNYVRSDGVTPIMTTNANALFIFGTLTNSWSATAFTGISGMSGSWTVFSGLTCSNYSLNSGSVTTTQYNQTGSGSLSSASLTCGNSYYLLCVEQ